MIRLEDRLCPAVTFSLHEGVLTVVGDSAPNDVSVFQSAQLLTVTVSDPLSLSVQVFDLDPVSVVRVFGMAGADRLSVSGVRGELFGGSGDDTLSLCSLGVADGGSGSDTFFVSDAVRVLTGSGLDDIVNRVASCTTVQKPFPDGPNDRSAL